MASSWLTIFGSLEDGGAGLEVETGELEYGGERIGLGLHPAQQQQQQQHPVATTSGKIERNSNYQLISSNRVFLLLTKGQLTLILKISSTLAKLVRHFVKPKLIITCSLLELSSSLPASCHTLASISNIGPRKSESGFCSHFSHLLVLIKSLYHYNWRRFG